MRHQMPPDDPRSRCAHRAGRRHIQPAAEKFGAFGKLVGQLPDADADNEHKQHFARCRRRQHIVQPVHRRENEEECRNGRRDQLHRRDHPAPAARRTCKQAKGKRQQEANDHRRQCEAERVFGTVQEAQQVIAAMVGAQPMRAAWREGRGDRFPDPVDHLVLDANLVFLRDVIRHQIAPNATTNVRRSSRLRASR